MMSFQNQNLEEKSYDSYLKEFIKEEIYGYVYEKKNEWTKTHMHDKKTISFLK